MGRSKINCEKIYQHKKETKGILIEYDVCKYDKSCKKYIMTILNNIFINDLSKIVYSYIYISKDIELRKLFCRDNFITTKLYFKYRGSNVKISFEEFLNFLNEFKLKEKNKTFLMIFLILLQSLGFDNDIIKDLINFYKNKIDMFHFHVTRSAYSRFNMDFHYKIIDKYISNYETYCSSLIDYQYYSMNIDRGYEMLVKCKEIKLPLITSIYSSLHMPSIKFYSNLITLTTRDKETIIESVFGYTNEYDNRSFVIQYLYKTMNCSAEFDDFCKRRLFNLAIKYDDVNTFKFLYNNELNRNDDNIINKKYIFEECDRSLTSSSKIRIFLNSEYFCVVL
jgi:hypothetical protein